MIDCVGFLCFLRRPVFLCCFAFLTFLVALELFPFVFSLSRWCFSPASVRCLFFLRGCSLCEPLVARSVPCEARSVVFRVRRDCVSLLLPAGCPARLSAAFFFCVETV